MSGVRLILKDHQWDRMEPHLPGKRGDPGRTGADNRLFLEAVLWLARTGSPWRDLPDFFGNWNSAFSKRRLMDASKNCSVFGVLVIPLFLKAGGGRKHGRSSRAVRSSGSLCRVEQERRSAGASFVGGEFRDFPSDAGCGLGAQGSFPGRSAAAGRGDDVQDPGTPGA
ncbi:transposase, partial [Azospirillum griseum]